MLCASPNTDAFRLTRSSCIVTTLRRELLHCLARHQTKYLTFVQLLKKNAKPESDWWVWVLCLKLTAEPECYTWELTLIRTVGPQWGTWIGFLNSNEKPECWTLIGLLNLGVKVESQSVKPRKTVIVPRVSRKRTRRCGSQSACRLEGRYRLPMRGYGKRDIS